MRRLVLPFLLLLGGCDAAPPPAAAVDAKSPEAARAVAVRYFALREAGDELGARKLWPGQLRLPPGHAVVGRAGLPEGACGSIYVEVPVRIASSKATVTLRRVNDVPGSTVVQRRWHIEGIALR